MKQPTVLKRVQSRASIIALAVASTLQCHVAHAYDFDTGDSDVKISWNNTFKYSTAYRLHDADARLLASGSPFGLNLDDGDQNFQNKGVISNRLDWLTELDIGTKNSGFRLSAASWYDSVYNKANDNTSAATNAAVLRNTPTNQFTAGTRNQMGRDSQVMDAFVFTKGNVGDMPGTVRLGKHSVIYGETLFFGANGIANAQGPVDLVKLLSVPGTEFKEILLPVNQISGELQLRPNLSLGGYYQFAWRPSNIPGSGSYLSAFDIIGPGTSGYLNAPTFTGAPVFSSIADLRAKNSGQFGLQLKYTPEGSDIEYGLYAARYNDKTPNFYLGFSSTGPATWQQVYAEGIKTVGASASTVLGDTNVAIEGSVRRNNDLNSDPVVNLVGGNNTTRPLYAVGNTAHINISAIEVLPTNRLFQGGSLLGELAWNRTTSITANASALDPNTSRDATAMRMIFSPAYYQILPGVDITIPVGLGYNIDGRSSAIAQFNGGVFHGGDFSIGINGSYQVDWKFGISYVRFLGATGAFLKANPATGAPMLSFNQALADRNFISLYVKRAF